MKEANLCYLVRPTSEPLDGREEVLLPLATGGPCKGRRNGLGGKYGKESKWAGVKREVLQESGVEIDPVGTVCHGCIDFYFEEATEPLFRVWMFVSRVWHGEPEPIEKMKDFVWFDTRNLPFSEMSQGDHEWLPELLVNGRYVKGWMRFGKTVDIITDRQLQFASRPYPIQK